MTTLLTLWMAVLETQGQHPYLGAFVMILMGAVVFFLGFRQYRQYRLLANAPRARVRSMPMGLVHLKGQASGEPLTSPLTGARCFTYVAEIEEWVKTRSRKGGTVWKWQTTAADDDMKPFYLDDGTGRVLVNSGGAEEGVDLLCTFSCEMDKDGHFKSVRPTPGFAAPSEQAVWAWIHGAHSRKLADKHFELEAQSVPGVDPARAEEFMLKFVNAGIQLESLGAAPRVDSLGGALGALSGLRGGPYRVTEKCFLAGSECVVLGTCAENPEARNEEDHHIIRRGENEKTFLISTQGEKAIGRNLRLQAVGLACLGAAMIVGGFALALSAAQML